VKRIVFVSATDELGGSDSSLFELVRCLDRERWEPHVVLPGDAVHGDRYRRIGVPVHVVPLKKLKNTANLAWHLAYLLRAPARVLRMARLLARLRPAIVHVNTSVELLAGFAARRYCDRSGAGLVWHVRELDLRPRVVERFVFGIVERWADAIVAISSPLGRRFAASGRVRVVHNGVDLSRFAPRPADARHGLVLGWMGRVVPIKGVENVLELFARVRLRMPGTSLLVVGLSTAGSEEYATDLQARALASPCGSDIDWRRGTSQPESAYVGMDLFVHLPEFEEPFGRTMIEAQACGVPVLTWQRGGLAETLEPGVTGIVVAAGDIESAADAAVTLLSDPARLAEMAARARALVAERFSSESCAARIQCVYEELLAA
jgi:glycosyltransferase involved in cell wall biosynthesis